MPIKPFQVPLYVFTAIRAVIYHLLGVGRKQRNTIKELFCLKEVCTLRNMCQRIKYLVSEVTS